MPENEPLNLAARLAGTPLEILARVLDESATLLAEPSALAVPEDELHREILVPLLPAMLGDKAIRQHWREQVAGFLTRLRGHLEGGGPAPQWEAGDFEIHVAASYLAGPDAKALADTLLSEESLRDLTAALMNQALERIWAGLPVAEPTPRAEVAAEAEPVVVGETEAAGAEGEAPGSGPVAEAAAPPIAEPEAVAEEAVPAIAATEAGPGAPRWVWTRPVVSLPNVIRVKVNPIRGTVHTHGGLAEKWARRNPLRPRRTSPLA